METKTIVQSLNEIMKAVGAISKSDRNATQGFNFRGIDSVVNAVSPQLQKYGVVVVPSVQDYEYQSVEIGKNRTVMCHVKVKVMYTFIGPQSDALTATVVAEAMDAGDKATTKAMSVAFRTALLQALCLPTDDADPDASSYERSEKVFVDIKAVSKAIAEAKDIDSLAQIGQYITVHKDLIETSILETLRLAWKEAQGRVAITVAEATSVPIDA